MQGGHNLLSVSKANNLSDAAKEWEVDKLDVSSDYCAVCELCGRALKKYAVIRNKATGATFTIGRNHLEELLCIKWGIPYKKGKPSPGGGPPGKFKKHYEDLGIDFHSFRIWFLQEYEEDKIPPNMLDGIMELKYLGTLSGDNIDKFIDYHDDKRKFQKSVLLPGDWPYLNFIPEYITIKEAKLFIGIGKNPNRADAFYYLGKAQYNFYIGSRDGWETEVFDSTISCFKESLRLNPNNQSARYYLCSSYWCYCLDCSGNCLECGIKDKAILELEKFYKFNPDDECVYKFNPNDYKFNPNDNCSSGSVSFMLYEFYRDKGYFYYRLYKNNGIYNYEKGHQISYSNPKNMLHKAIVEYEKAVSLVSVPDNDFDRYHGDLEMVLASLYYQLACAYSQKNEKVKAIESLQKAITLEKTCEDTFWEKTYLEEAKSDTDLDNIRDNPEFQRIIDNQD